MITLQDTFDRVVSGLRAQGAKSGVTNEYGIFECKYKGPLSRKCAAGLLIEDSEYQEAFEGKGLLYYDRDTKPVATTIGSLLENKGYDLLFVQRLQSIHDNVPIDLWEEEFKILAENHKLIYTAPS